MNEILEQACYNRSDMPETAYIYGLRATCEDRYFYVGSTKFEPKERLRDHLDAVSAGTHFNRHFSNKVRKVGAGNILVETLQETAEPLRWSAEKLWIEKLLDDGHPLVNLMHNLIDPQLFPVHITAHLLRLSRGEDTCDNDHLIAALGKMKMLVACLESSGIADRILELADETDAPVALFDEWLSNCESRAEDRWNKIGYLIGC